MVFSINHTPMGEEKIRRSAVAGAFYPADAERLSSMIAQYMEQVHAAPVTGRLIGLVAPHAGYIYSGHVAAYAYHQLSHQSVERVVVISPSHIIAFDGAAVYDGDAYQTPLGLIPVDKEFCRKIADRNPLLHLSGDENSFPFFWEEV